MPSTLEQLTGQARRELAKVIVGQAEMIDLLLLTIVCNGHALLEGVPGLAKTLAAHGAKVWINYHRSEGAARSVGAEIEAAGGRFGLVRADVTKPEDVARMGAVESVVGEDPRRWRA